MLPEVTTKTLPVRRDLIVAPVRRYDQREKLLAGGLTRLQSSKTNGCERSFQKGSSTGSGSTSASPSSAPRRYGITFVLGGFDVKPYSLLSLRPPNEDEMRYCLPYLRAQIEVVNPSLLVALGSTAAQGLLGFGSFKALGDIRGKWHQFADKPLMVTYHPSYILRNPTNRSKRMIWEDLLKVMERAGLPISEKQRGFFLDK